MSKTDWIVVGGGSAGCVVAARLADPNGSRCGNVTILEPPTNAARRVDRERPAKWLNLLGSSEDWKLTTSENPQLANRALRWPRGRGLGGSSRINAMIWFPPTCKDLQMLVNASGGAWNLAELQQDLNDLTELTRPEQPAWQSEASQRFLDAAKQFGAGAAWTYMRLNRSGRRWNPARLFNETQAGDCIEVQRTTVNRLICKGDRIIGVETYDDQGKNEIFANKGVIICAGAIATPAILMRSGIGPRDQLEKAGIEVCLESEQVGQGLQDHLIMPMIFQVRSGRFPSHPSVQDIARWQTMGTGPLASNLAECGGLFMQDSVQIHVTPTHYLSYPKQADQAYMTLGVNATQPQSLGMLQLQSSNPQVPPSIHPHYLQNTNDRDVTITGMRLVRRLVAETDLSRWIVTEALPGNKRKTDQDLGRAISRYSRTLYHPAGTSRFGATNSSVVTPEFRLKGFRQAWVVDGSILPRLPHGNPNATIMLLAFKAANRLRKLFS
ncbi:MAG: GMC family oxidoreductase [Rubripirellula sp.]